MLQLLDANISLLAFSSFKLVLHKVAHKKTWCWKRKSEVREPLHYWISFRCNLFWNFQPTPAKCISLILISIQINKTLHLSFNPMQKVDTIIVAWFLSINYIYATQQQSVTHHSFCLCQINELMNACIYIAMCIHSTACESTAANQTRWASIMLSYSAFWSSLSACTWIRSLVCQ